MAWLLVVTRRYAQADTMLARVVAAHPDDRVLLDLHALAADRAFRHDEAIVRWQRRRDLNAAAVRPWWRLSFNLRARGRYAEADVVAREALDRFPDDPRVIEEAAYAADMRYDYQDALRLWHRLVTRRKVHPSWSQRYADNLIVVGRVDEAAEIIASARRLHPRHPGLEVVSGLLAAAREDWKTAITILARFHASDPENPAARELLGRVLQLRAYASLDGVTAPAPLPVEVGRIEDDAIRTMLLGFESLGLNCEFGIVQRRYGAEPLGLFRWNATTPTSLLLGLASRFDGLGDPAHLRLTIEPAGRLYVLRDKRYEFEMNTFIFEGQVEESKFFKKMSNVLIYLRDRFLSDLEDSQKILVYKDEESDQEFISLLSAALRRYGPAILLWVLPIDSRAAGNFPKRGAGQVVQIGERLYVGFLSRLGSADSSWDVPFDEWVEICEWMTTRCGGARQR